MKLKNIDPDRLAIVVCYMFLIIGAIGMAWVMSELLFRVIWWSYG